MNSDVRHPSADVDECLGLGVHAEGVGVSRCADDGEGREVDHDRRQPCVLHCVEARTDHLAAGGDEQHAQHPDAGVVGELFERMEVHDGLVDRDRNEVLHLEGERVAQLLRLHPQQIDLTHDDLLVRDAENDSLGRELRLVPEHLQRCGDGVPIEDLAIDDGTDGQGDLTEALEGITAAANRKLGGAYRRRPDIETDGLSSSHDAFPSNQRSSTAAGPGFFGPCQMTASVRSRLALSNCAAVLRHAGQPRENER